MPVLTDLQIRRALQRVAETQKEQLLVDGEGHGVSRLVLILKPMPKRVTANWNAQQWRDGKRARKRSAHILLCRFQTL